MRLGQIMTASEAAQICAHCRHERMWHSLSSNRWYPPRSTNCLATSQCKCPGFEEVKTQ